jgi:hypothetical protein
MSALEYEQWRDELFRHPPDSDPSTLEPIPLKRLWWISWIFQRRRIRVSRIVGYVLERSEDFYDVTPTQSFDFIDRVLLDPDVHDLFTKDQLGNGIYSIYSNLCSGLPFLYTTECDEAECDEDRRVLGIYNLVNLYKNFFERYCTSSLVGIGNLQVDGQMGYVCYMFWDIFALYPGNATPKMQSAAISVMRSVLDSCNDSCLASAIHGLGHWASYVPEAVLLLNRWLAKPTTKNQDILNYARSATTGKIM